MVSSIGRKKRRLRKSRPHLPSTTVPREPPASPGRSLEQLGDQMKDLAQVMAHNHDVLSQGFFMNDVWMYAVRLVLDDVAEGFTRFQPEGSVLRQLRAEGVGDPYRAARERGLVLDRVKGSKVDWAWYWQQALEAVQGLMAQQPEKTSALAMPGDSTEVEFGGNYEVR